MAVLEITQLRLKALTVDDPILLKSLSQVRCRLQTNSHFFSCINEPGLIYILGFWPSLDAHLEFLASPERDEILGPQEDILDFQWTAHLELVDTDPLILDMPFIAIEQLVVDAGRVDTCDQVIKEHVRHLQMTESLQATHGWRCDMPTGSHEVFILISSSSKRPCSTFSGKHTMLGPEGAYQEPQFHCAQNMERSRSDA